MEIVSAVKPAPDGHLAGFVDITPFIAIRDAGQAPAEDGGADIPDYQKTLDWDTYTAKLPFWVYLLLFLGWGALMWRLWKRLDRN